MDRTARISAMAPFDGFDKYTSRRVFPPAFRIARASVLVYLLFMAFDFALTHDHPAFVATLPFRAGALVGLILMAAALGHQRFASHRVPWTFLFGLISEMLMVYWNLFLLHQPVLIIFIVMYFLFGVLTVAPAVSVFQYVWAALATVTHVGLQLLIADVALEMDLQIGLFLVPALFFLGHAVYTQRTSAKELWALAAENHRHSTIDTLSQVLNRGTWYRRAAEVLNELPRWPGAGVSFVMLDIDHFKLVNDTWGHEAGDQVISLVAEVLTNEVRDGDLVGRLGGEEFGVLLPDTDISRAGVIAERIRTKIESLTVVYHGQPVPITVSLGYCTAQNGESLDQLIRQGDACLYRAKHAGRNRAESCDTR